MRGPDPDTSSPCTIGHDGLRDFVGRTVDAVEGSGGVGVPGWSRSPVWSVSAVSVQDTGGVGPNVSVVQGRTGPSVGGEARSKGV